jgi:hypothetical protein
MRRGVGVAAGEGSWLGMAIGSWGKRRFGYWILGLKLNT